MSHVPAAIPSGPLPESLRRGHELRDANIGAVAFVGVGLFVLAVLVHIGMWLLFGSFQIRQELAEEPRSALAATAMPPPEPRLQPSPTHDNLPHDDLLAMRAAEQAILQTDGPGRISIDRAMDLIANAACRYTEEGDHDDDGIPLTTV